MGQDTVVSLRMPGSINNALTELLRKGAKLLMRKTVQIELSVLVETNVDRREGRVRSAVIRNG